MSVYFTQLCEIFLKKESFPLTSILQLLEFQEYNSIACSIVACFWVCLFSKTRKLWQLPLLCDPEALRHPAWSCLKGSPLIMSIDYIHPAPWRISFPYRVQTSILCWFKQRTNVCYWAWYNCSVTISHVFCLHPPNIYNISQGLHT